MLISLEHLEVEYRSVVGAYLFPLLSCLLLQVKAATRNITAGSLVAQKSSQNVPEVSSA